jgi:phosphohistidine phosphatase
MKALILFRHAKAEATSADGDHARELTASGRATATAMGLKLAEDGLRPDLVLVSSATRTRQTWELASAAFPRARVETRRDLYDATADAIAAAVKAVAMHAEAVVVVGHNPGLQTYAIDLLKKGGAPLGVQARVAAGFPPATAAMFAIDEAGRASLDGLFDPRELPSA